MDCEGVTEDVEGEEVQRDEEPELREVEVALNRGACEREAELREEYDEDEWDEDEYDEDEGRSYSVYGESTSMCERCVIGEPEKLVCGLGVLCEAHLAT
jgi:hypothetical protein